MLSYQFVKLMYQNVGVCSLTTVHVRITYMNERKVQRGKKGIKSRVITIISKRNLFGSLTIFCFLARVR